MLSKKNKDFLCINLWRPKTTAIELVLTSYTPVTYKSQLLTAGEYLTYFSVYFNEHLFQDSCSSHLGVNDSLYNYKKWLVILVWFAFFFFSWEVKYSTYLDIT